MIETLAIAGYRSLHSLVLSLGSLNLITGPNGSGKSNLYRALRLLSDAASGRLMYALAREGGLPSVLWAGPEQVQQEGPAEGTIRKKPVSLRLGFAATDFSFAIDLGLPAAGDSAFPYDPEIKRECAWQTSQLLPRNLVADRRNRLLKCRDENGQWRTIDVPLTAGLSMLSEYSDPFAAPELIILRDQLRGWRFYDAFRTDPESAARRTSVGTLTPVLDADGSDLAAAFLTVRILGRGDLLQRAIADAFPGASVQAGFGPGGMELWWHQQGMLRPLGLTELSDGTLRFLLLAVACLSPRPPQLMVVNEPENSLHPALIPALGRLLIAAAEHSQMIVVSHSQALIETLTAHDRCRHIPLEKHQGATRIAGQTSLAQPSWKWPSR